MTFTIGVRSACYGFGMESEVRLDVRSIPPPQRHPKIFALFDALPQSTTLVLVTDHEPRPLRAEFDRKRSGVKWAQRDLGGGRWEVRLDHVEVDTPRSPVALTLWKSGLFGGLGDDILNEAAYHARRVSIRRHRAIAGVAMSWPYLGIVERGTIQAALATLAGREQTVYEVLACEPFGEVPILDGGSTPLRFTAVTSDTVAILLPAEFVRTMIERFPSIGTAIATVAAQRFRLVTECFAGHLSQSTTSRVASVLLTYARPDIGLSDALEPLPQLTQTEIAARAGTVKEVVSRALSELQVAGALQRRSGHIARLDRAKLFAIAKAGF